MRNRVIRALLILLGGFALAFAIVYAGCSGEAPFGMACAHAPVGLLIVVTFVAWFVLAILVTLFADLRSRK